MSKLASRFTVSFVANVARSGLTFVTAILLARALGPTDFGRLSFLIATFTAARALLDLGSSHAFFTLLSRHSRSRTFVRIFWFFVALQLLLALAALMLLPDAVTSALWAGEPRLLLILAFLAAFMQGTVWTLAVQMAEASRRTMRAQSIQTIVVVVHLAAVAALAWLDRLSIPFVLIALAVEWALAALLAARLYETAPATSGGDARTGADTPRSVLRELVAFCAPLVPTMMLGVAHDFADRWMLQTWSGAREQAFFSVAQQYSAVSLLATTSVLRILWKEIAEAHAAGAMERVRLLYDRGCRTLFFVAAFMCGALQPLSPELLRWSVGEVYLDGAATMAVMLLVPLHQCLGQIGGTLLFATGRTRTYAICSSVGMLISLLGAYIVLAPDSGAVPGLRLGSVGLAWKIVVVQVLSVNLLGWAIARGFGWSHPVNYQILATAVCVATGWAAHGVAAAAANGRLPMPTQALLGAILYAAVIAALVYRFPWLLATSRSALRSRMGRLLGRPAHQ